MAHADRIKPTDASIISYLDDLRNQKYQIPTFQRNVVWEEEDVKKLWDSIYKFYPIGSILIWRTDVELQDYRNIGGHVISGNEKRLEYKYILDGQQRTTALLTSMFGGKIEGKEDFDPTLHFDVTIDEEKDDGIYKERFLFWKDIDNNKEKKERYDKGLIVSLKEVKENFGEVEEQIISLGEPYASYNNKYRQNLLNIKNVLDSYSIPFIELREIEVSEVCKIFERINQEGEPLNIFDIVVAKTYRREKKGQPGFYLRELVDDFREEHEESNFIDIDDKTYLQILAIIIRQNVENSGVRNITDRYLNEIKAEHIEEVWPKAKEAILKTFDFFENHLRLKGPRLIPFRYFYMSIASYFYDNSNPNYDLLKKYFWYYSFHTEELLRNTTHLRNQVEWLEKEKNGEEIEFDNFVINKSDLRYSSYSSRSRFSRAILSFLSNQEPKDWKHPDRSVLNDVYYILKDKPNLHHIFPKSFLDKYSDDEFNKNSLMNIAYLPKITNLEIGEKNPISYLRNYNLNKLEKVFKSHLIPVDLINWSKENQLPEGYFDRFIESRIELFITHLKEELSGIKVDVIDTKGEEE